MTLNKQILQTGADLYYDPTFTGTIKSKNVADAATAKSAVLALEAVLWETTGYISGLSVAVGVDGGDDLEALNCGVGIVATLADSKVTVSANLLEAKNFELWETILGGKAITDTSGEFYQKNLGRDEVLQGAYRIVSCAYPTGDATAGKQWARDYYYIEKAVLTGELSLQFIKTGELPAGTDFNLETKAGGGYLVYTRYGATKGAVETAITFA